MRKTKLDNTDSLPGFTGEPPEVHQSRPVAGISSKKMNRGLYVKISDEDMQRLVLIQKALGISQGEFVRKTIEEKIIALSQQLHLFEN